MLNNILSLVWPNEVLIAPSYCEEMSYNALWCKGVFHEHLSSEFEEKNSFSAISSQLNLNPSTKAR